MKRALFVLTQQHQIPALKMGTGFDLTQLIHPWFEIERAEGGVDLTSPYGGETFFDENSKDLSDPLLRHYFERQSFHHHIKNTLRPQDLIADHYGAIYFVGGLGALWDFPRHRELQRLMTDIYSQGGALAATAQGVAAFLGFRFQGQMFLKGKSVTAATQEEDQALGVHEVLPFSLQEELENAAARFTREPLWRRHCVVDERLITGQNGASARGVGEALLRHLRA